MHGTRTLLAWRAFVKDDDEAAIAAAERGTNACASAADPCTCTAKASTTARQAGRLDFMSVSRTCTQVRQNLL